METGLIQEPIFIAKIASLRSKLADIQNAELGIQ